jgi:outer membrane protein OmpU
MKKVLFATTALVATAGVASADIALSGSAQMGIQGGNNTANDTTQFVQDIDITFTMSGTADNGTTFGAAIDLDENAAGVNQDDAGVAIFISGDLGTLTLGDTDGALDWAMQEVDFNGAASINDDHTTHAGFNGNGGLDGHWDGQILRYDYSFGDFSFAVSVEQDDNQTAMGDALGVGLVQVAAVDGDPVWGIGAKYSGMFAGGTFGVGIGYQTTNDGDQVLATSTGASVLGISANVALDSGFSVAVNYSMLDTDLVNGDATHMAIGASYTFDAITVTLIACPRCSRPSGSRPCCTKATAFSARTGCRRRRAAGPIFRNATTGSPAPDRPACRPTRPARRSRCSTPSTRSTARNSPRRSPGWRRSGGKAPRSSSRSTPARSRRRPVAFRRRGRLRGEVRALDLPLAGLMCIPPVEEEAEPAFRAAGQDGGAQRAQGSVDGHERRFRKGHPSARPMCASAPPFSGTAYGVGRPNGTIRRVP